MLTRIPPSDVDAEAAVLGSLILDCTVWDDVESVVAPGDFFDPAHQTIAAAIWEICRGDSPAIDVALLVDRLKARGDWEKAGGAAALFRISDSVPNASHARYYARIIREHADRRRLLMVGQSIILETSSETTEVDTAITNAESSIQAIREHRMGEAEQPTFSETVERILCPDNDPDVLPTGYTDLDDVMGGGFRRGNLIILAGRPSMGKTAVALNMAGRVCASGWSAHFASLEMSVAELHERLLTVRSKVPYDAIRRHRVHSEDMVKRLRKTAQDIDGWSLGVDAEPIQGTGHILASARRFRRRVGRIDYLFIDYLQLIDVEDPRASREQQVSANSRRLKLMAKELDCAIVLLAQLNRKAEEGNGRPKLSHLRESGAIEQDADMVLFVHREGYQKKDPSDEEATSIEVIIGKQRNGSIQDIQMFWDGKTTRMESLSRTAERIQDTVEHGGAVQWTGKDDKYMGNREDLERIRMATGAADDGQGGEMEF